MPDGGGQPTLAARLNRLFDEIRSDGPQGRKWTNEDVATRLKERNPHLRVSGAYLSALRTGARQRPSSELLAALAKFFGVPVDYFVNDEAAAQVDAELELLKVMSNYKVRALALRAAELSPEMLTAVAQLVEQALELDGKQHDPAELELSSDDGGSGNP